MLNGTAWCSLLSGCLVSSGRQAPSNVCYFGRFCHIRQLVKRGDSEHHKIVVEPPEITLFQRRSSSTRHLSAPKVSYIGQFCRAHHTGELESIHILPPKPNNEYELIILSPFHTTRVLGNYLLQYHSSECPPGGMKINM